ncbi:BTAD domain-containing putative transcriptional regulator [Sphaerisporangium fuscum]|uniref:BTAD domain-containing putative transcriptional regulator n=1 Tax=Sphaerisporangium fuscum TaxID=2835868 RepID=UPI001BDBDC5D|nr:BTAD domain-containing putative transcriptional regulator [Sphaerisporangium fuscum]
MVRISVLGTLRASVGGTDVDLGTARQRAVLARLVAEGGRVVSTDRFIDDLWQGQPPPKALAALQVYVSNLRRALEPDRRPRTPASVLVSAPPGYRLQLGPDDVDVWRFPRMLEAGAAGLVSGAYAEAAALIDQALALFGDRPYGEFAEEEWAAPEVARLEELRLAALEYRAEAHLGLGRHVEAVPDLENHVRAHPLRENAVRLLALALYRSGRQGDALTVLRKARRHLAEELGLDPGPALRELEADILVQAASLDRRSAAPDPWPPPPEPRPAVPDVRREPEMVGRAAELGRLEEVVRRPADGFRMVWVAGDAGSGKSTLLDALAALAEREGLLVAYGRCPETGGGAPPGWAWSEVLRGLVAHRPPSHDLAARLAPLLTDDGATSAQFLLARALAEYLTGVAASAPLLVVLEDVHRADGETLHLLRYLAVPATPVLVVASYRPAEAEADLTATRAALAARTAAHLDLPGLDEAEVARLLLDRSGLRVDAATARVVTERTGGNPLFVCETARLLATDGSAAVHALPPGVRDLIRRRVARLPGTAQTVLRDAAIVGRDVDVEVLLAMHDAADEETVLAGLEAGVLTGLLAEPRPGHVRFAHVLVQETLYEDTPKIRRARLHGRVLTALERVCPADVAALGHHALAAATTRTVGRAVEYAAAAARRAAGLHAHAEAARLLQGALDLLADERDPRRLDLLCRLVSARAHAGDVLGALDARAEALAEARRTGDREAVARALTAYDAPVTWTIQPNRIMNAGLVAAIEEALAGAEGSMRCRLLVTLTFEVEGHDLRRAEAAGVEALEIARRLDDPELLCRALNARSFSLLHPAHREELEENGRELLDVGARHGLLAYQTQAHHSLFMVALGHNDLETARHHADRAVEYSTSGQFGLALSILAIFDALAFMIRGDFEESWRRHAEVVSRMEAAGGLNAHLQRIVGRFIIGLARGDGGEMLSEMRELHARLGDIFTEFFARALVAAGRLEEARAVWHPESEVPRDYTWLGMMSLRGETAVALGDHRIAERCYEELLPWRGELGGLHCGSVTVGPVAHILGDIALLLGRADVAAGHFEQAVQVAEQVGSPHWAERARQALGRLRPPRAARR